MMEIFKIILIIAYSLLLIAAAVFVCIACVWFIRDLRSRK